MINNVLLFKFMHVCAIKYLPWLLSCTISHPCRLRPKVYAWNKKGINSKTWLFRHFKIDLQLQSLKAQKHVIINKAKNRTKNYEPQSL